MWGDKLINLDSVGKLQGSPLLLSITFPAVSRQVHWGSLGKRAFWTTAWASTGQHPGGRPDGPAVHMDACISKFKELQPACPEQGEQDGDPAACQRLHVGPTDPPELTPHHCQVAPATWAEPGVRAPPTTLNTDILLTRASELPPENVSDCKGLCGWINGVHDFFILCTTNLQDLLRHWIYFSTISQRGQ